MECRDVRSLADAYLSGELLVETTQALVQHLERCPACRADLGSRRRLRGALRAAFESAPDLRPRPEFLRELESRLRHQASAGQRAGWRSWLVAAACVALAVGVGSGGLMWVAERSLAELAHLAAGDHQNCALKFSLPERPVSLTEAARFDAAFGRLDTVALDGRAPGGEPIEYVERHACVYLGQRFAHVVVRYKGTPVSLLVAEQDARDRWLWPATRDARPVAGDDRFSTVSFRSADRRVFVVSTLPSRDVLVVANALRAPLAAALGGV